MIPRGSQEMPRSLGVVNNHGDGKSAISGVVGRFRACKWRFLNWDDPPYVGISPKQLIT